jgi:hypothetical protein
MQLSTDDAFIAGDQSTLATTVPIHLVVLCAKSIYQNIAIILLELQYALDVDMVHFSLR